MLFFDETMQSSYQNDDWILAKLKETEKAGDHKFTSHQWLTASLPKRLIFSHIYGDLLDHTQKPSKILDVGGGYTSLTRTMLKYHQYQLLDIMAHDEHECVSDIEKTIGKKFWINGDWFNWTPDNDYDIIIANDLFPNVDQRLFLFLEKYLPLTTEIRISLTYYNQPRWYRVRRTDADEIFHMMAINGRQTAMMLESFNAFIRKPNFKGFLVSRPSLFENERQVCLVTLNKGDKY
jgi:hypothetical protein